MIFDLELLKVERPIMGGLGGKGPPGARPPGRKRLAPKPAEAAPGK